MRIFLAADEKCLSEEKIKTGKLGGTERFFLNLYDWVTKAGIDAEIWPSQPSGTYDVCVHSTTFNPNVMATKHIMWTGSWHTALNPQIDKVITVTEFMKRKKGWTDAVVIHAPYQNDLAEFKDQPIKLNKIACNSNPERHYTHTVDIAQRLNKRRVTFSWHICGGNALYCDQWGNTFNDISVAGLNHHGVVTRREMVQLICDAELWVYPYFSSDAETQSVAPLEAAYFGIPVILPNVEPFTEILPNALFVDNVVQMANLIQERLSKGERIQYDLSKFSPEYCFQRMIEEIREV